jgi:hypothetical protein
MSREIWRTADGARWFLLPEAVEGPPGELVLRSPDGRGASVHPAWARPFEVGEEEGRAFAKEELGAALGELREGIDGRLAELRGKLDEAKRRSASGGEAGVGSDALPALFALLKGLPGVIGNSLSGQAERVERAKAAAAEIEGRLRSAGVDVGDRLSAFPERLEGLRNEAAGRTEKSAPEPPDAAP